MLRLSLHCQGIQDESLIPAGLQAGGNVEDPLQKFGEQKRLLEWLAEVCDMKSRRTCHVLGDLQISGERAVIGHAVQFALSVQGDLNLTVPKQLETTVVSLLSRAGRSTLSLEDLEGFASAWDMLSVEMSVEGHGMPGLFLLRRDDSAAIVISTWPKLPKQVNVLPSSYGFDAARFFSSRQAAPCRNNIIFLGSDNHVNTISFLADGTVQWHHEERGCQEAKEIGIKFFVCEAPECERFCLTGPFGTIDIVDPPPGSAQRDMVQHIVSLSLQHEVRVYHAKLSAEATAEVQVADAEAIDEEYDMALSESVPISPSVPGSDKAPYALSVSKGDSVEVQHAGEWLLGVLQEVKGDLALVSCDAEHPDIIIAAPLRQVRAPSYGEDDQKHGINNKSLSQ